VVWQSETTRGLGSLDRWARPAYNPAMAAELHSAPSLIAAFEQAAGRVLGQNGEHCSEPIQVLLPRVEAIVRWQRRLGPCAGVRAHQFYDLARTVLDRAAVPVGRLNGDGAAALVRHLLACMDRAGELTTFSAVASTPGFARALLEWVREMRTQEITPEQIEGEADRTGSARDAQLGRFYRRYHDFLAEHHLEDADGLLAQAADALAADPGLLASAPLLVVLGFDQFSPVQLRLLQAVAQSAREVAIYLTWDNERPQDSRALSRLRRTREDLLRFAHPAAAPVPDPSDLSDGLERVRRRLFEPADLLIGTGSAGDSWRAVAAASREGEVRRALADIKALLLGGVLPADVALLAPHPDRYAACISATAREFGVPVSATRKLGESPVIQALLKLLSLPPAFPRRETFDALRSPYLRAGFLSPLQVAQLDRLTRERVVVAGREQWQRALRPPPPLPDGAEDEDRLHRPFYATIPAAELAAIAEGLESLFALLQPPEDTTVEAYAVWVQERFLGLACPDDDLDAAEEDPVADSGLLQLAPLAPRDEWDALRQVPALLERLVDEAALLGTLDDKVPWESFRRDLSDRLLTTEWSPETPVVGVRFGPLEAGRAVISDHLFVLGLSEGEFPALPPPDPFYHLEERQAHPLPLRRPYPEDDACLWWQVLGAVRRSVTMLRPRFDERAAPWPPSPYWEAVLACVPGLGHAIEEPPIVSLPAVSQAASPGELLTALTLAGRSDHPYELLPARRNLDAARLVLAQRAAWGDLGPHEGVLAAPDLSAELEARYGAGHGWSLSRLNRYGLCPYSFFAAEVLGLEAVPDPQAGLDALVRGSLVHELLERLFRAGGDRNLTLTTTDLTAWLAALQEVAPETLDRAPATYGFLSGPLWRREREELVRLVAALVRWECQQNGENSRFRPHAQELRFGLPGGLPALILEGNDNRTLRLRGVIDRLDADANGNLRVIDYKSGTGKFSVPDILAGRALQTALYALAAERLIDGARVVESYFLLVPIRETTGRLETPAGAEPDERIREAAAAALRSAAAVCAGWFPLARDLKGCRYCDAAALCRTDRHARAKARQASRS